MEEGRIETFMPIVGEKEVAERHEEVAVAPQPERVALVELELERGWHHRSRHTGHPLEYTGQAAVVADDAVATDVIVDLVEVEDERSEEHTSELQSQFHL